MGMPDESSMWCEECRCFNIQYSDCIFVDGEGICDSCMKRFGVKTKFNEIKKKITSSRGRHKKG